MPRPRAASEYHAYKKFSAIFLFVEGFVLYVYPYYAFGNLSVLSIYSEVLALSHKQETGK